jgi:hypothetical protein
MKSVQPVWLFGLLWLIGIPGAGHTQGVRGEAPRHEARNERALYEGIEIMRRILREDLQKALAPSAALPGHVVFDQVGDGLGVWTPAKEANSIRSTPALGDRLAERSSITTTQYLLHALKWSGESGNGFVPAHSGVPGVESIEGFYLPGYGIVFSATVQAQVEQNAPQSAQPAPKPLSQWDRVRKELHGEKTDDPQAARPAPRPTLTEVLLRALAENGHHFSDLPPEESLAVAVTLRQGLRCELCHGGSPEQTSSPDWNFSGPGPPGSSNAPRKGNNGGKTFERRGSPPSSKSGSAAAGKTAQADNAAGQSGPAGGAEFQDRVRAGTSLTEQALAGLRAGTGSTPQPERTDRGQPSGDASDPAFAAARAFLRRAQGRAAAALSPAEQAAQDNALLGDLHMKQGRYQDALEAYQKAVQTYRSLLPEKSAPVTPGSLSPPTEEMKKYLTATELAAKLAQAYLAAGQDAQSLEAARAITDQLNDLQHYYQKVEQARGRWQKAVARPDRQPALPAKVLVSARKADLDAIAAGKISFDEFRKRAIVQRVSFDGRAEASAEQPGAPLAPGSK